MDLDNVVQNINISTIIPPKEQLVLDNDVQKLIDSIRENGISEPLLLRPKNNKYEIIIGNKRYEIARILGLKTVPALVKEIDDEVVQQYKMINSFDKKNKVPKNTKKDKNNQSGKFINIPNISNNQSQKINSKTNEFVQNLDNNEYSNNLNMSNFSSQQIENTYDRINRETKKSDIINLSELNKEYEREDLKMNNNQINNIPNNNMGMNPQNMGMNPQNNNQVPQEPTFGGRFFPSLEDEPTNMNMGGINPQTQANNNLIDLTDMGSENTVPSQALNQNIVNNQPVDNNSQFNIRQSQEQLNPIPGPTAVDNIISIDNLQNNNQLVEPQTIQPESQNIPPVYNQPQSQEIPNMMQSELNSVISSVPEQSVILPQQQNTNYPQNQYDMSQNISPSEVSLKQEVPQQPIETAIPENIPIQNDFSQQPQMSELINNSTSTSPVQPEINSNPSMNIQVNSNQKDLSPVLNTLKNLAINLEAFGYKLNISEENLENSVKLVVEIEK